MPDVLVRDVDVKILTKLKERAKRNGRSLQNELTLIFQSSIENEVRQLSSEETAAKIREMLKDRVFSDSTELLREDRRR